MKEISSKTYSLTGGSVAKVFLPSDNSIINFADITQTSRYPQRGFMVNHTSTEALFVVEGEIRVNIDGVIHEVHTGECIYILPMQAYSVSGKARVIVASSPCSQVNSSEIIKSAKKLI